MDLIPTIEPRAKTTIQNRPTGLQAGAPVPTLASQGPLVLSKYLLVFLGFIVAFLMTDGSSSASQGWEGAPPCYWPVGLGVALFLGTNKKFYPLVVVASVIAASVNYHRPLLSWSGLPGAVSSYLGYILGAGLLKGRWRIDPQLKTMRDVTRYVAVMFGGALWSAFVGTAALTADGLADRRHFIGNLVDWWASDAIAVVTFTPLLLTCVMWRVTTWLGIDEGKPSSLESGTKPSSLRVLDHAAQVATIAAIVWMLFAFVPAIPYQPLYLLFIPVIWAAVRDEMRGATLAIFGVDVGLAIAAWITQAPHGTMPRLQLALLTLGITGMCLGAVVTEWRSAKVSQCKGCGGSGESSQERVCRKHEPRNPHSANWRNWHDRPCVGNGIECGAA